MEGFEGWIDTEDAPAIGFSAAFFFGFLASLPDLFCPLATAASVRGDRAFRITRCGAAVYPKHKSDDLSEPRSRAGRVVQVLAFDLGIFVMVGARGLEPRTR